MKAHTLVTSSRLFALLILVSLMIFSSCKKEEEQISYADPSTILQDQYGRQIMLRGMNHSNKTKRSVNFECWITEADVDREDKEFGWNFVRLLTSWEAIEPEQGVYDFDYLDRYEQRVRWYTDRGMYVLIDMHNAVYGKCIGGWGHGHPDWSCMFDGATAILPLNNVPWWFRNIDPRGIAAWVNFFQYTRYQFLQDHYAKMWQVVAARFKDNPYVIGYDLMNEPWGGDPVRVLNGEFERKDLAQFTQRMINAIREVDQEKYIFFEPLPAPVTFGFPTYLPRMEDTRASRRLVYAPHLYPLLLHENNDYSGLDRKNLRDWERERRKDQRTQVNAPLLCGEFGVSAFVAGFDEFLISANTMFDKHLWHWAYWFGDWGPWVPHTEDRQETAIMPYLVRTYPKATAGTLQSFNFDVETSRFDMSFLSNPNITQATEIFVPSRHYPNGWDLKIEGTKDYSYEFEEARQLLKLTVKNAATVKVVIEAK